jgi:transcriptional regulator with PAS, ATPase and Fis domain
MELAHRGTLFLDEVGDIPLDVQPKLLRALQEREFERVGDNQTIKVDVRVIAATNSEPARMVQDGSFREDLYYRLNVIPVRIPPLRERRPDIPLLAQHFLDRLNQRYGTGRRFTPHAMHRLLGYDWPGNARELKHAVQRAWVMSGDELDMRIAQPPQYPLHQAHDHGTMPFRVGMTIEEMEKQMLLRTLAHFDNDKTRTAEALGVSLKTIYNKLSRYQHEDRE